MNNILSTDTFRCDNPQFEILNISLAGWNSLVIINFIYIFYISFIISIYQKETINENKIDEILSVDHAGEVGASKIYEGQIKVLGNTEVGPMLQTYEGSRTRAFRYIS